MNARPCACTRPTGILPAISINPGLLEGQTDSPSDLAAFFAAAAYRSANRPAFGFPAWSMPNTITAGLVAESELDLALVMKHPQKSRRAPMGALAEETHLSV